MTTFITDENIPISISNAMGEIISISHLSKISSTVSISSLGRGATDQEIMDFFKIQKGKFVIITNDRDFKKRPLLSQIMTSKNVSLFLIKFPKGSTFYRRFKFIVNHWEKIQEISASTRFPFAYKVSYKSKFEKI